MYRNNFRNNNATANISFFLVADWLVNANENNNSTDTTVIQNRHRCCCRRRLIFSQHDTFPSTVITIELTVWLFNSRYTHIHKTPSYTPTFCRFYCSVIHVIQITGKQMKAETKKQDSSTIALSLILAKRKRQ